MFEITMKLGYELEIVGDCGRWRADSSLTSFSPPPSPTGPPSDYALVYLLGLGAASLASMDGSQAPNGVYPHQDSLHRRPSTIKASSKSRTTLRIAGIPRNRCSARLGLKSNA